jgi:hypothetical protein
MELSLYTMVCPGGGCGGQGQPPRQPVCSGGGGGAGTSGIYSANITEIANRTNWINAGRPGKGGDGIMVPITGNNYYWGAGGGGGGYNTHAGDGGLGGGGGGGSNTTKGIGGGSAINSGVTSTGVIGGNAGAHTGSGGGGAGFDNAGIGGSGIVIIRYPRTKIPFDAQWTYNTSNANVYHMGNVGIGTTNPTNALHVEGDTYSDTYSGGSKTFKIEHPLKLNKWLYHGCIEGPRFDNIYRGKKVIIEGKAEVDIDTECNTTGGMTSGTFPILNTNYQLYLQNNKTFDRVKGTIIGSKIQIESQNVIDEIEVDWLVVGERHDKTVINPEFTDSDGNLICEHDIL